MLVVDVVVGRDVHPRSGVLVMQLVGNVGQVVGINGGHHQHTVAGRGLGHHLPHGFGGGDAFGNEDPLRIFTVADGVERSLFRRL